MLLFSPSWRIDTNKQKGEESSGVMHTMQFEPIIINKDDYVNRT